MNIYSIFHQFVDHFEAMFFLKVS